MKLQEIADIIDLASRRKAKQPPAEISEPTIPVNDEPLRFDSPDEPGYEERELKRRHWKIGDEFRKTDPDWMGNEGKISKHAWLKQKMEAYQKLAREFRVSVYDPAFSRIYQQMEDQLEKIKEKRPLKLVR